MIHQDYLWITESLSRLSCIGCVSILSFGAGFEAMVVFRCVKNFQNWEAFPEEYWELQDEIEEAHQWNLSILLSLPIPV